MEIVIGDVVVRAGGDVELNRLADVIRAVRKADPGLSSGICGEHAGRFPEGGDGLDGAGAGRRR